MSELGSVDVVVVVEIRGAVDVVVVMIGVATTVVVVVLVVVLADSMVTTSPGLVRDALPARSTMTDVTVHVPGVSVDIAQDDDVVEK
jgi:hypothetical protein